MTFLIAAIVIIVYFVTSFNKEISEGYNYVERASASFRSKVFPVPSFYRQLLQKYFRYYQGLSAVNKSNFEQRVCRFIYSKQFFPRGMKDVPTEMKLFIAATAVQLTFGLPHIYLQHFNKILVYPDNYYSSITRRYHKGEVNPAFGIIVLSWSNFMGGFLHTDDAVNLGLHEMAHALRLENLIRNEEFGFFEADQLEQLDQWGEKICEESNEEIVFFRSYACVNRQEFFAVAVENFFERSADFKRALPELYHIMSKLLKQDPLLLPEPTESRLT